MSETTVKKNKGHTATASLPLDSSLSIAERKAASHTVYTYLNRIMFLTEEYFRDEPEMGFTVFDRDAVLLKLYGNPSFYSFAGQHGIRVSSKWDMESAGMNAVSLAFRDMKPCVLLDRENDCPALYGTAVYFCPIQESAALPLDRHVIGGIAVIVPYERRRSDLLGTAVTLTTEATLHLFMSEALHSMYRYDSRGLVVIDKSWKSGKYSIVYNNSSLSGVLGIGEERYSFRPVEELFAPLPQNEAFWGLLTGGKVVKDLPVTLTAKDRTGSYLITTEVYRDPGIKLHGMRFFITSPTEIAARVSRQVGNTAVWTFDDIIGQSQVMIDAKARARRFSESDSNILLSGESGVGKDIFAQAIHNNSARRQKPFVTVNCAALPRDLIESELFGYERGSFTGAKQSGQIGKFELANGGTIFLDEIGDMPLDLQAVLLQVIEKKSFMRIGGTQPVNVDVKVICATNADLGELIRQKHFRLDLYYRLSVLKLELPPLRERENDAVILANHFLRRLYSKKSVSMPVALSEEAASYLRRQYWFGNVRELQNVCEGVALTNTPGETILPAHIRNYMGEASDKEGPPPDTTQAEPRQVTFPEEKEVEITKETLERMLIKNHFRRGETAEELGISRKTLYRWMKKYDIS